MLIDTYRYPVSYHNIHRDRLTLSLHIIAWSAKITVIIVVY